MPVREKRYECGKVLEIDMYHISKLERDKSRKTKKKESRKEQKNLNAKNAIKHIIRKINKNFTDKDLAIHLTYDDENLPTSEKVAKKDVENYIRRLNRYRKKHGLPPMKYIGIIEYKDQIEGKKIRIHHHLIIDGDVDRDTVEKLWKKGRANADRLKADEFGYESLARYISKDPKGKKRWMQSKGNLIQPIPKINNHKYSYKKMWEIAKCQGEKEYIQKLYPGYILTKFEVEENIFIGTLIYIKMRKLE